MIIKSKCPLYVESFHNDKTCAICKAELFIFIFFKKIPCLLSFYGIDISNGYDTAMKQGLSKNNRGFMRDSETYNN